MINSRPLADIVTVQSTDVLNELQKTISRRRIRDKYEACTQKKLFSVHFKKRMF